METYKHLPTIHCPNPHCGSEEFSLVAYAYDNGSAKWSEYRCALDGSHFRVNRQYLTTEVMYLGKTRDEIRQELIRISAMQNSFAELHRANAPDDYFHALVHSL